MHPPVRYSDSASTYDHQEEGMRTWMIAIIAAIATLGCGPPGSTGEASEAHDAGVDAGECRLSSDCAESERCVWKREHQCRKGDRKQTSTYTCVSPSEEDDPHDICRGLAGCYGLYCDGGPEELEGADCEWVTRPSMCQECVNNDQCAEGERCFGGDCL